MIDFFVTLSPISVFVIQIRKFCQIHVLDLDPTLQKILNIFENIKPVYLTIQKTFFVNLFSIAGDRFSTLSFLHQSIPLRSLGTGNILKYFWIEFWFRVDIREYVSTPHCAAYYGFMAKISLYIIFKPKQNFFG
jgi:hypothetical protein